MRDQIWVSGTGISHFPAQTPEVTKVTDLGRQLCLLGYPPWPPWGPGQDHPETVPDRSRSVQIGRKRSELTKSGQLGPRSVPERSQIGARTGVGPPPKRADFGVSDGCQSDPPWEPVQIDRFRPDFVTSDRFGPVPGAQIGSQMVDPGSPPWPPWDGPS